MVRNRRWQVRAAGLLTSACAVAGCQAMPTDRVAMSLTQAPPTVQAAYNEEHPGTLIRSVTRDTRGNQHYYTVQYQDGDGDKHDVVYNGAGDVIDKH